MLLGTQCTLLYTFRSGLLWIPVSTQSVLGVVLDHNFWFCSSQKEFRSLPNLTTNRRGDAVHTPYSLWPLYGSCRLVSLFHHYVLNVHGFELFRVWIGALLKILSVWTPGFVARLRPASFAFGDKANFKCDFFRHQFSEPQ